MTNKHFFETKEQYLAFRRAWANAVNSEKAKSHIEPCDEWLSESDSISRGTGRRRVKGWITPAHHILYNIIRNRPFDTGFTPVTNTTKLQNGAVINHGLCEGYYALKNRMKTPSFLEPFAGTITPEMLDNIEVPEVRALYSDYGKGRKIASAIISSETKPTTFKELDKLVEEAA